MVTRPIFKYAPKGLRGLIGLSVLGIVVVACLVALLIYSNVKSEARATAAQKELEQQMARLSPMMDATLISRSAYHKATNAIVSADYKTALNYHAIRTHYDSELAKLGWKFVGEENVIHNDRNYGGKHAFYCKGQFTADIQYAGLEEMEVGFTYSIGLTWRIFDKCSYY